MEIVDDVETLIRSTTDYMNRQDLDELKKLIEKFKKIDNSDSVLQLEKSLDGQPVEAILAQLESLVDTTIPKSKLLKFKMLLDNIMMNQYRILFCRDWMVL